MNKNRNGWTRRVFLGVGSGLGLSITSELTASARNLVGDWLDSSLANDWDSSNVRIVSPSSGLTLTQIPLGTWGVGTPKSVPERGIDEAEVQVRLTRRVAIGTAPVSQGLYHAIMGGTPLGLADPSSPATGMNWFDAVAFCNRLSVQDRLEPCYQITHVEYGDWGIEDAQVELRDEVRGYRLPTEAEWEIACRLTIGDSPCPEDYVDSGYGKVWQWCQDWYASHASHTADSLLRTNPTGSARGVKKVVRGGSPWCTTQQLRPACRGQDVPQHRGTDLGLRVALAFAS